GEALQALAGVDTVVLDKTGTLTEGRPVICELHAVTEEAELIRLCASAEKGSEHPVAKAIIAEAQRRGIEAPACETLTAIVGRGIRARVSGIEVLVGNEALMRESSVDITCFDAAAESMKSRGEMLMYAAVDGEPAGLFGAVDEIKPDSRAAVNSLHKLNINTIMLTGDNEKAAEAIAEKAGVGTCRANVLPEAKAGEIEKLRASGKRVCMVGDGINDAPALASADVGVAIGSGTFVAVEAADVVLMGDSLRSLEAAVRLSKKVLLNVRENLFWAFFYNCICIPFAAGLFYTFGGPLLPPELSGAAMALSSVCVVSNALRLKRFK
ncbi:MAG: HAD-IC family P-type ATPase, partial [Oscillospiraceae bacterium]|nr:HAD-IC family P-type ATPase [Oscillospiraceae bacterium]